MSKKIVQATDIIIDDDDGINLFSVTTGKKENIKGIVGAIEIYESMDQHTIMADFRINDAVGLFSIFPIQCEEYIELKMQTPGTPGVSRYILYVNEVLALEDNKTTNMRSYTLRCVSGEYIRNQNKSITFHYNPSEHWIVAKNMFYNRIGPEFKELEIEQTVGYFDFMVRHVRPFQIVDLVTERAKSLDPNHKSHSYYFYEDKDQFNFVTVEYLIEKWLPLVGPQNPLEGIEKEFWLSTYVGREDSANPNKKTVLHYELLNEGSATEKISSSSLASETRVFDIMTGTAEAFCYKEEGYQFIALDGADTKPLNTDEWRSLFNNNHARKFFLFKDRLRFGDPHPATLNIKRSFEQLMNSYGVKIRVFGRTDISAGHVIRINTPHVSGFTVNKRPYNELFPDPKYGGHYIVRDLKHHIVFDNKGSDYRHYTVMTCVKPHLVYRPGPDY
jgi:hypothetical protein